MDPKRNTDYWVVKNHHPFEDYVCDVSLREHPILKELREYTMTLENGCTMTHPLEIQFISMLLKLINAKKCLEVGTFTGYNVLNCALSMPEDGVVHALDVNEDYVKQGYPFFEKAKVRNKIKIHIGLAIDSMDNFIENGESGTFDFVYIDADKLNYQNYLERAYRLIRAGGLIVVDNTLLGGTVANLDTEMTKEKRNIAEFMHGFNERLKTDSRFQLCFLDISDGVTVLRKQSPSERLKKENLDMIECDMGMFDFGNKSAPKRHIVDQEDCSIDIKKTKQFHHFTIKNNHHQIPS